MAPSSGRLRAPKRASNLRVFSLSRTFRQTVRLTLRSRARQTFDMLPWPVRPISSKRFSTLIRGRLLLPLPANIFLRESRKPTLFSVLAIVNDAGQLGAQVL